MTGSCAIARDDDADKVAKPVRVPYMSGITQGDSSWAA